MPRQKTSTIKNWIKSMGFELIKSQQINRKALKVNYYSLGNFGIYEEISNLAKSGKMLTKKRRKYISWTPWGIDFEVNSVKDLSKAYQDSLIYNPEIG